MNNMFFESHAFCTISSIATEPIRVAIENSGFNYTLMISIIGLVVSLISIFLSLFIYLKDYTHIKLLIKKGESLGLVLLQGEYKEAKHPALTTGRYDHALISVSIYNPSNKPITVIDVELKGNSDRESYHSRYADKNTVSFNNTNTLDDIDRDSLLYTPFVIGGNSYVEGNVVLGLYFVEMATPSDYERKVKYVYSKNNEEYRGIEDFYEKEGKLYLHTPNYTVKKSFFVKEPPQC